MFYNYIDKNGLILPTGQWYAPSVLLSHQLISYSFPEYWNTGWGDAGDHALVTLATVFLISSFRLFLYFFWGLFRCQKEFFKRPHICDCHNVKFKPYVHINAFAFIFVSLVCSFHFIIPGQTRLERCSDWKAVWLVQPVFCIVDTGSCFITARLCSAKAISKTQTPMPTWISDMWLPKIVGT